MSTDRLVDEVWLERPPRGAVNAVQAYVMRLRRLLGGDGHLLVTQGGGYQLSIDVDDIDGAVFERLVESGRRAMTDGQPAAAVTALTQARALWRGAAFADVPPSPTVAARAAQLDQLRLDALEERIVALLESGQTADALAEVRPLVERYPLREGLWLRLMQALCRCGRRAEALAAYQRARRVLLDELGLEPGSQIRQLHRSILAESSDSGGPAPALAPAALARPVPAQLPPDVAAFTGRSGHLAELDRILRAMGTTAAPPVVAIAGAAGIGKTALAVHWAQRTRERFPDGQLYLNLRGHSATPPMRRDEALARLITALGVPADQVPADPDHAAALYRSALAGRRVLVLLDNARDADQVRPLIPGSSGCLVLVTSRHHLGGLVARDGALAIPLGTLDPTEAHALIERLVRAPADAEHVELLARLCGYLPLALRIAAAQLTAAPGTTIAEYAARLADGDRLAALEMVDDPATGVRVAFEGSYGTLPAPAQRIFRLLGLAPGPDIDEPAVAALAGLQAAEARGLLEELVHAHLVDRWAGGRYTCHDLLHLYARALSSTVDSQAVRSEALDRLLEYYVDRSDAAARLVYPHMLRLPQPGPDRPTFFDDRHAATGWFATETPNLVAAIRHTAEHGPYGAACLLADALRGHFHAHADFVGWETAATAALAAATAGADDRARAAALISLASMHTFRGELDQAVVCFETARDLTHAIDWPEGQSTALGNLGAVYRAFGRPNRAAESIGRALALDRRIGWRAAQATKHANLGLVYGEMGQLRRAADHLERALSIHRESGSVVGEAASLSSLGEVLYTMGRYDEARATLTEALGISSDVSPSTTLVGTIVLGGVERDLGRYVEALKLTGEALRLSREIGDARSETYGLNLLATIHLHEGRHAAAIDVHREALALARAARHSHYAEAEILVGLAVARRHTGDVHSADADTRQALDITRRCGYRVLRDLARTQLAVTALERGEPRNALRTATRILLDQARTGHRLGAARTHLVASAASTALGNADLADTHRHEAHTLLHTMGLPWSTHLPGEVDHLAR